VSCDQCEILPDGLAEVSVLYISAPIEPAQQSLRRILQTRAFSVTEPFDRVFRAEIDRTSLEAMCENDLDSFSKRVLQDTRTLLLPREVTPTIGELVHMEPLSALRARVRGEQMLQLLREHRLTTFFQPIFSAADRTVVHAHECLLRGLSPDGSIIAPSVMLQIAREANLLFFLDREARLSSIRQSAFHSLGKSGKVFINFNPTAIYAPEHCLRTTVAAAEQSGIPRENLVFEIIESDSVTDTKHLVNILNYYRERGFKVALDDLGAGYNSLTSLSQLRPDYMKLDMELTRGVQTDEYRAAITENLLNLAGRLGIATIAEGIETEEEFAWLKEHGADYVQGFLLARPESHPFKHTT